MRNIFENAYFGKPYNTTEDTIALYLGKETGDFKYRLALPIISNITNTQSYIILQCDELGCSKSDIDIVSEWKEEISEEELDELATKNTIANLSYDFDPHDYTDHYGRNAHWVSYKEGWKDAYRKVIEKYGSN